MDFRERPRRRPDDVACSVCRESVAPEQTRLLARHEDFVFVELHCPACASVTLGFVFAADEQLFRDRLRLAGASTISGDDVLDMHDHLEGWRGDLRSLLLVPRDRPGSAA